MIAGRYDIIADQGSTFTRQLRYEDSTGVPVDLTNFTAEMELRDTYCGSVVLALTTAGTAPSITLGGTAGTIDVVATATQMGSLAASVYVYDLELTSGAGEVTKPVRGSFEVRPEVTL